MLDSRTWRRIAFLIFLLILAGTLMLCGQDGKPRCLGVEILSEDEMAFFREDMQRDLSGSFLYNGQKAAVDAENRTIYIPQKIRPETKPEDLAGNLKLSSSAYWIAFAPDEAFGDLAAAVAENHRFRLYAAGWFGGYTEYHVVFTTLPVLRIDGEFFEYDEREREVNRGSMCLWDPEDPETGLYTTEESNAHWHVRGGWSSNMEKTPFKLNLKKKTGTNKNLSMVGLGADDDWILNPMNLDDTDLKEKLFISLWNQRADQVSWNEKMSEGKYAEVVINGSYAGLYQLQRRIDGKLLSLGAGEVLFKGNADWDAPDARTAYEIVHSSLTEEETYGLIEDFFAGNDTDILDLDNFLDVNLFLQCAAAVDNTSYKNMYYLLKTGEDGYRMHLIPWDTDMSWGTVWRGEGFVYDFEESRQREALRWEYNRMEKIYPDLDRKMAERWLQLRESLLTLENMAAILEQSQQLLDASGAQKRDVDRWGLFYEGQDSPENLCKSLEARLEWVDEYYSKYLQ